MNSIFVNTVFVEYVALDFFSARYLASLYTMIYSLYITHERDLPITHY